MEYIDKDRIINLLEFIQTRHEIIHKYADLIDKVDSNRTHVFTDKEVLEITLKRIERIENNINHFINDISTY